MAWVETLDDGTVVVSEGRVCVRYAERPSGALSIKAGCRGVSGGCPICGQLAAEAVDALADNGSWTQEELLSLLAPDEEAPF